jgi:ubiquinone/menaquinone biosynthesis C-methylase UbiE
MTAQKFTTWEAAVAWLIEQPDKQDIVRECYYDSPAIAAAERFRCSEEWESIRSYLPEGKGEALEIGAGRGISSYALAKDGWKVSALEPDPSNLVGVGSIRSLAQTANLPIKVVQEFGEKLPFESNSFEVVYARQVLHHARDLKQLCAEVARVLKPGGTFIAIRDHMLHRKSDLNAFLDAHPLHNLYGGENAYLYREYSDALSQSPLTIIHSFRSFQTPIHYSSDDKEVIRRKVKERISKMSVLVRPAMILTGKAVFPWILSLASRFDRRPGAAVSFICRKPGI